MTKTNINLKTLLSLPNFYIATLSHDEKKLAYYYDKTGRIELYVMDLATRTSKQVSNGEFPKVLRSGFIWDRDNISILFTKDKDGNEQNDIYKFNTETSELTELHISPTSQEYIVDTSENGEWISFMSNKNGQMNVFMMRTDGSDVKQLTATDNPSTGGTFSPDMKYLSFNTNEEGDMRNSDIYLLELETGNVERLVQIKVGSKESFGGWSKDGNYIYFTTDVKGNNQAGVYNMNSREYRLYGDGTFNISAVKMTTDNSKLICMINKDASVYPVIFDVETSEMEDLDFPAGISAGGQLMEDRYLFLTVNMPTSPSSLVMFDIIEKSSDILLAPDTGDIDITLITDAEHIWYKSLDGTAIPAIVYKPRDFDTSKKYPGLVLPHGGPTGQYFMTFSLSAQIFTDLGYVLIFPNVRGSTGYGAEFRDACIKDWGGKDHEDWIAARQYLIDNMAADPDRIGIIGGSYGGYATLWAMTNSPDLWAAGIANVPISHIKNLYDKQMDHFKYYVRQQMGDPENDKELWEERSPLNYAENIKAPLLLIHGENDPRCPVTESTNFVDKLEKIGKKSGKDGDFEFIKYDDIGHGGHTDINFRIREFTAMIDFFQRRL